MKRSIALCQWVGGDFVHKLFQLLCPMFDEAFLEVFFVERRYHGQFELFVGQLRQVQSLTVQFIVEPNKVVIPSSNARALQAHVSCKR